MPTDDELSAELAAALDDGPSSPPPERLAAVRQLVVAARDDQPAPASPAARARGGARRWVLWGAAAAAAVIVLTAAVALQGRDRDGGEEAGVVEFDGPMTAPGGATVDADLRVVATGIGRELELVTDDLPILPNGELYHVWFVAPTDRPGAPARISAGTFHPDRAGRTDVRLAAAVDPVRYPRVEVTAEPADGDPGPNGPVVLEAVLGVP